MNLPSKELLSEVLGENVSVIKQEKQNELLILANNLGRVINIYELQYKCKEWALDNGYEVVVFSDYVQLKELGQSLQFSNDSNIPYDINDVFLACQWILENR